MKNIESSRPLLRPIAGGLLLAATALTQPARAAESPPLLQNPTVDDLREGLAPAAVTRSFRPTAPPNREGLCSGQGAVATAPTGEIAGPTGRNLVPVPMPDDEAPRVNLAVQFDTGSDVLKPEGRQLLDRLAQVLREPTAIKARFAVAGHTDATGGASINLALSCARAIAVRRHLVERGQIEPGRISAYGFGSAQPLELNVSDSAVNRRVEVRRAD